MAMLIRERHLLPTLRLWLGTVSDAPDDCAINTNQPLGSVVANRPAGADIARSAEVEPHRPEPVLCSQILYGQEAESAVAQTPLKRLGLLTQGKAEADLRTQLIVRPSLDGTAIAGQMAILVGTADPGEALWLHIAQSSPILARLPWEAMLRELTPRPFLRIPNFLTVPYVRKARPHIVICASAPIGDGLFVVENYIRAILDSIEQAANSVLEVDPTIHVFVDQEIHAAVMAALNARSLSVIVPIFDPRRYPRIARAKGESIVSVWLEWIADELGDVAADVVHFVGPSFIDGERGALVLAERPDGNRKDDTMLGASELIAFYDRVGCAAMLFSNPELSDWVEGQRALAYELSWLRAGPIILTEGRWDGLAGLDAVYDILFGRDGQDVSTTLANAAPIQICCHPEMLHGHKQVIDAGGSGDRLSNYIRNQAALLEPTRYPTKSELSEVAGQRAALDFLTTLVAPDGTFR